jgi:hypothetical protein
VVWVPPPPPPEFAGCVCGSSLVPGVGVGGEVDSPPQSFFFFDNSFHYVAQTGLKLGNPQALPPEACHHTWPVPLKVTAPNPRPPIQTHNGASRHMSGAYYYYVFEERVKENAERLAPSSNTSLWNTGFFFFLVGQGFELRVLPLLGRSLPCT